MKTDAGRQTTDDGPDEEDARRRTTDTRPEKKEGDMKSMIDGRLLGNDREAREVADMIKSIEQQPTVRHEIKVKAESNFTPRAILAWFFTWTLCATGFVLAMTIAATLAKMLKMLVP